MIAFQDKHAALVAFVLAALRTFDSRFRVVDHIHDATINGADERTQVMAMGNPARFAEVIYVGDVPSPIRNLSGAPAETTERFEVGVWWQRTKQTQTHDEADFLTAIKGKQGLVTLLYTETNLSTEDGDWVDVGDPQEVAITLLDIRPNVQAHYARFSLTIT